MHEKIYFANEPREKIAATLYSKVEHYYDEIDRNGRLGLWKRAHRRYFALDKEGRHEASDVVRSGEQGELSFLKANHYRNLLQHLLVLTTQQRPAFECQAINTDYQSMVQTILGRNVLEYYMRAKRLAQLYRLAAEYAIVYAESYMEVDWDARAGDPVTADLDAGEMLVNGDVTVRVYAPIDVIRRCKAYAEDKHDWYILRRWVNRYELAAEFPEYADFILQYAEDTPDNRLFYEGYLPVEDDDDLIPVYVFYHDRTAACERGRKVVFLGSEVALAYDDLDDEIPMPVSKMVPQHQHGTTFGYTVGFDLLCVQESIDTLYSTIYSNQSTFGVQNIWLKPGSTLSESQLGGGLNIFESMEKPEAINLTNTPAEIFNFVKMLETLGEVLSGVNSVARGQPEASLKSGSALALVASQAVQFSNGLQAAYVQLIEDTGYTLIKQLQRKAALPRTTVTSLT
jgi:hypothetical protein